MYKFTILIIFFIAFSISYANNGSIQLKGAGSEATFFLFNKLNTEFAKSKNIDAVFLNKTITNAYKQLKEGKIDFVISFHYPSYKERKLLSEEIISIPFGFTSIAICFNVPGINSLDLNWNVLEGIFKGEIKKWNSPLIKIFNKDKKLPEKNIIIINYPNESENTLILSDFLSKRSKIWKNDFGRRKRLRYISGIWASKNSLVPRLIRDIPYSLGYVGLSEANIFELDKARILNLSGKMISPDLAGIGASINISAWEELKSSSIESDNQKSYPMSTILWMTLYKEQSYNDRNYQKTKALYDYIDWLIHPGQGYYRQYGFIPLTEGIIRFAESKLKMIVYRNKSFDRGF